MKVSGQFDRTIQPGQTEKVEIAISIGQASGRYTRNVLLETNDRDHRQVTLSCVADIKTALTIQPPNVVFGQIARHAEAQSKVLSITRGSGGPIAPKVVSTGNERISAELREIEAGERYELDIIASPPWPNGPLHGAVVLETGIEQSPRETIPVFGQIKARLTATPSQLVITAPGTEVRAYLSWDENPGKVLEATVNDPKLSVEVEEHDGRQLLVLRVPEDYELVAGKVLNLKLQTDDDEVPTMNIPVYSTRLSPTPRPTSQPTTLVPR